MFEKKKENIIDKSQNKQAEILEVFIEMVEKLKGVNHDLAVNSSELNDEKRRIEMDLHQSEELMKKNFSLIENIEKIFKV